VRESLHTAEREPSHRGESLHTAERAVTPRREPLRERAVAEVGHGRGLRGSLSGPRRPAHLHSSSAGSQRVGMVAPPGHRRRVSAGSQQVWHVHSNVAGSQHDRPPPPHETRFSCLVSSGGLRLGGGGDCGRGGCCALRVAQAALSRRHRSVVCLSALGPALRLVTCASLPVWAAHDQQCDRAHAARDLVGAVRWSMVGCISAPSPLSVQQGTRSCGVRQWGRSRALQA